MMTISLWWRAVRPFAYPASIVPALLGTTIAWANGFSIHVWFAILTVIGAVAAHTGANLMNDYIDFRKGVDRPGTLGGSGILVEGIMRPQAILTGSIVAFAIAFAVAIPCLIRVGMPLVWLVAGGLIAGAGYVLPPFRLKYRALGDATVFLAFGLGIALGSYMIQTMTFSWTPVLYAIPVGMLVAAILHTNNLRDMGDDREAKFSTIAGIIGERASRFLYAFYVLGAYAFVVFFVLNKNISIGSLATLLTLPLALHLTLVVWRAPVPAHNSLVTVDAKTAQLNLAFGLAMILGIVAWKLLN